MNQEHLIRCSSAEWAEAVQRWSDATRTPLAAGRFSGAVCLTMLHHVPTVEQQDAVLAEILRLLRPGAVLAGQDSLASPELQALQDDDVYLPIDPAGLAARLDAAGFGSVLADTNDYAVRFRAVKITPPAPGR